MYALVLWEKVESLTLTMEWSVVSECCKDIRWPDDPKETELNERLLISMWWLLSIENEPVLISDPVLAMLMFCIVTLLITSVNAASTAAAWLNPPNSSRLNWLF